MPVPVATAHTEVPIWRVSGRAAGNVRCARSVRGGQEQIGRSVSGLDCEEVPGSGHTFEVVFTAVLEFDA
jgi:hypothetical protein